MCIAYTTILAIGTGTIGRLMKRETGISRWGGKVVGLVYIGIGLQVVLQSR